MKAVLVMFTALVTFSITSTAAARAEGEVKAAATAVCDFYFKGKPIGTRSIRLNGSTGTGYQKLNEAYKAHLSSSEDSRNPEDSYFSVNVVSTASEKTVASSTFKNPKADDSKPGGNPKRLHYICYFNE